MNWVLAIFKHFNNRYLHKWSSAIAGFEKEVAIEWSEQLAGLTGNQIKHGLDHWDDSWPPSSTQFRKCCKNLRGFEYKQPSHTEFRINRLIESDEVKAKKKKAAILAFNDINTILGK